MKKCDDWEEWLRRQSLADLFERLPPGPGMMVRQVNLSESDIAQLRARGVEVNAVVSIVGLSPTYYLYFKREEENR